MAKYHQDGVTYCEHKMCEKQDCKYLKNFRELDNGFKVPNAWQEVQIKYCVVNNYENYKSSR